MQKRYNIKIDAESDAWNWWFHTSNVNFHGYDFTKRIVYGWAKETLDALQNMSKAEAREYLATRISSRYEEDNRISEAANIAEEIMKNKSAEAIKIIEKITKKPLFHKIITIKLTTFPGCSYNHKDGAFFIFYKNADNVVDYFLHEVLHIQFHKYWQENPASPVSKLSKDDFEYLKESLTVVLDDSLRPLISNADRGYPAHQKFRKTLHDDWTKHHDFDKLVEFGVKNLPTGLPAGHFSQSNISL